MRYRTLPVGRALALASLATTLAVAGCKGSDSGTAGRAGGGGGDTGGTLVVATAADADFLFPPLVSSVTGRMVTDLLFDRLAEIGDDLNVIGDKGYTPRLADRWTWAKDSLSIAFHIDPRARWHDGQPVRASDLRYTYRTYVDPGVGSTTAALLGDIDSVSTTDSATAVVWYKRRTPHQFFDAAYQLVVVPEHVYGATKPADLKTSPLVRQAVGSGRFRLGGWQAGQKLELVSDTANYRGRAKLDRVILSVVPDFGTAVGQLFAGQADWFESLRAEQIAELGKHPTVKLVPYPALTYGYVGYNLHDPKHANRPHPVLGDVGVRRALAMAVDRQAVVRNVFDSLAFVSRGPFVRATAGDVQVRELPYDTAAAGRLLDSLGWKRGADGMRAKGGKPLAFSVMVPVSSASRSRMAVLIQEQLRRAGVRMDVDAIEFGALVAREKARDFDAYFGAWNVDPLPASIRQTWGSEGLKGDEGTNFGGYSNPRFDAQVDSGVASMDPARGREAFQHAYQTIIDDAPALWVYEPRAIAGAHQRIRPTGLRADGWWNGLADWTIPEDARIDRDRIGLGAPKR